MKRIVADPTRCLACRACEVACSLAHADTDDLVEALLQRGVKPRIYIESAGSLVVPLQCRHCDDAPCVAVCPSGALSRPEANGPVAVDEARCIGCAFCVEACPFGVIRLGRRPGADTSEGPMAVVKCDLCAKRQAEGLEPACVASCPVGALAFVEVEDSAKRARRRAAAQAAAAASREQ